MRDRSDEASLVAGALYLVRPRHPAGDLSDCEGELLYWTGFRFLTEDGEPAGAAQDYVARQTGETNPDFIESAPPDSGIAYQAGYAYACGYHD